MEAHGRVFARLKVQLDDGRITTLFALAWNELSPHVANLYRQARTQERSGRYGKDGKPACIADSTVNRELTTLQAMLTYHRDVRKTIASNPLDAFQRTGEEDGVRQTALTPEQVEAFLAHAHPMFQDICRVAYRCVGMRHTEARMLKKAEIDWEAKTINLPVTRNKNRRARQIPFPLDVETILRHHAEISRGPYVFVNPRDPKRMAPVLRCTMQFWLIKARKLSGMQGFDGEPIVIHTFRHSGVTALVEAGAPERFIRAAAGMSPKTFERYTKFQRAQQEILRGFQNRTATAPTPITAELADERRPASPTSARPPRLKSVVDSD